MAMANMCQVGGGQDILTDWILFCLLFTVRTTLFTISALMMQVSLCKVTPLHTKHSWQADTQDCRSIGLKLIRDQWLNTL